MNDNVLRYIKRVFNLITILGFVATIVGGIYLWRLGAFQNQAVLQQLIVAHRFLGPLIFLCMQILQVIVPIIPGGITMAAGVMIFGPVWVYKTEAETKEGWDAEQNGRSAHVYGGFGASGNAAKGRTPAG